MQHITTAYYYSISLPHITPSYHYSMLYCISIQHIYSISHPISIYRTVSQQHIIQSIVTAYIIQYIVPHLLYSISLPHIYRYDHISAIILLPSHQCYHIIAITSLSYHCYYHVTAITFMLSGRPRNDASPESSGLGVETLIPSSSLASAPSWSFSSVLSVSLSRLIIRSHAANKYILLYLRYYLVKSLNHRVNLL